MATCSNSKISARAASSVVLMLLVLSTACNCNVLNSTFYEKTCPKALNTISSTVKKAIAAERRMAASLVRLHFHDCFVQGCDASVMLDETSTIKSEKNAFANSASVRGYEVIEGAKTAVERICPGIVSCADIIAVAARDASAYVGGPTWTVLLGRRDSTTANRSLADDDLPFPKDNLDKLISRFEEKGLTARDMVALTGAHTIGQAQCFTFRDRIYKKGTSNDTKIDNGFCSTRKRRCPPVGNDSLLAPFDFVTPNSFDNNYYKNLLHGKGLLETDQVLYSGGSTDAIVTEYSKNPYTFKSDFASSMVKMGNIDILTGSDGQIRKICSAVN